MFGSKRESKADLRQGMWERGPKTRVEVDEVDITDERGPDVVRPDFHPQADGQTTHE